jgi:uncharacterized membrane protein YqgA involved in biofilm formation
VSFRPFRVVGWFAIAGGVAWLAVAVVEWRLGGRYIAAFYGLGGLVAVAAGWLLVRD